MGRLTPSGLYTKILSRGDTGRPVRAFTGLDGYSDGVPWHGFDGKLHGVFTAMGVFFTKRGEEFQPVNHQNL